jgi:pimeloyl-ACP methyl ester carboxylesterase
MDMTGMKNLRKYGNEPYTVVVIHGGPGAPGEMAPVARELSTRHGVLEILNATATLDGQVQEILTVLKEHGDIPITLIGHSWGAMLAYIFAARYPLLVKKLIMVCSGVFEARYAKDIMETRLARLDEKDLLNFNELMEKIYDPAVANKNAPFTLLGKLISKVDSFHPLPRDDDMMECSYEVFQGVWDDAEELRSSGELIGLGAKIICPVVAIHGDHDPHPAEGVREPLSRVLGDFRFIIVEKCGHYPWLERFAKDRFYDILREELCG